MLNIQNIGFVFGLLIASIAQADTTENLRPTGDTAEWRQNLSDKAWE